MAAEDSPSPTQERRRRVRSTQGRGDASWPLCSPAGGVPAARRVRRGEGARRPDGDEQAVPLIATLAAIDQLG